MSEIIKYENVKSKVFILRGENVIIDRDVAKLYGVETKAINQAVSRNFDKFPDGYIIVLNHDEWDSLRPHVDTSEDSSQLRSQNVTANMNRALPKAFTEKGLYMLATILKSPVATQTTIAIIDAFANLRELNRNIKQLPYAIDENEQSSLSTRIGNALLGVFDDDITEIKGDERSMELNLPFIKLKRTVTLEKRKE